VAYNIHTFVLDQSNKQLTRQIFSFCYSALAFHTGNTSSDGSVSQSHSCNADLEVQFTAETYEFLPHLVSDAFFTLLLHPLP
jgi:hypothetical protein